MKKKKKKSKRKSRFKKIREKFRLILTHRKNKLYMKTSEKGRAKEIKPTTKKQKQDVKEAIKEMKKAGIKKIDLKSEVTIKAKKSGKK